MWELFLAKPAQLSFDAKQFSLHSFIAGGAPAAANAGAPDHLFKRHEHWRSESAKDGRLSGISDDGFRASQTLMLPVLTLLSCQLVVNYSGGVHSMSYY